MNKNLLILSDKQNQKHRIMNGTRMYGLARRILPKENVQLRGYSKILKEDFPYFPNEEKVIVILYFPFHYWEGTLEREARESRRLYGTDKEWMNLFKKFWNKIQENLEGTYPQITYLNHPSKVYQDRDKIEINNLLKERGIPVAEQIKTRDIKEIKELSKERGLFAKVRFGAEGKCITYLSPSGWYTNIPLKKGDLDIEKSYKLAVPFLEFTNNEYLLKRILEQELIIEEELVPPLINEKKFDIRSYVLNKEVVHRFIRTNYPQNIITNWSQGGTIESEQTLKENISQKILTKMDEITVETTNILDLNLNAIDIIFNKSFDNPLILETQCFPGFPHQKRYNLNKRILEKIVYDFDN